MKEVREEVILIFGRSVLGRENNYKYFKVWYVVVIVRRLVWLEYKGKVVEDEVRVVERRWCRRFYAVL